MTPATHRQLTKRPNSRPQAHSGDDRTEHKPDDE
jgi:hypothetical protein